MKKDRIENFLNTLLKMTGMVAIVYIFMIVSSCELIIETDSLIMTIQKDLDSLNAKGY